MKLVEEIREIAESLNHLNGRKSGTGISFEKELADVVHYIIAITNVLLEEDKESFQKNGNLLTIEDCLKTRPILI